MSITTKGFTGYRHTNTDSSIDNTRGGGKMYEIPSNISSILYPTSMNAPEVISASYKDEQHVYTPNSHPTKLEYTFEDEA